MDWIDTEVPLSERAAAVIYEGMQAVALADGLLADTELSLLKSFAAELHESDLPADLTAIDSPELQAVYLRSLIMVALADGGISETERGVINQSAARLGIETTEVALKIVDIKRYFVHALEGVAIFREAVMQVARDLGLPDNEIARISGLSASRTVLD